MSPEQRYVRDPQFKALVDMLEYAISQAQYTPTEIREASLLACINFEMRRPHRLYLMPEGHQDFQYQAPSKGIEP